MMNRKGQEREGQKEGKKMEVKIEKEIEGSGRGEGVGKQSKGRSYPWASVSSIFTLVLSRCPKQLLVPCRGHCT